MLELHTNALSIPPPSAVTDDVDAALVELGRALRAREYRFTAPTPETHRRVNARPENARARTLTDIFGWSRPFDPGVLPGTLLALCRQADVLEPVDELLRSQVRFSTLGNGLFIHSAHPTAESDAVFFGPDTYRFARLLRDQMASAPCAPRMIADIGCGSGAGALSLALAADAPKMEFLLTDINQRALRFSAINAELNGIRNVRTLYSDVLRRVYEPIDLIVANPPYLLDDAARLYRHGGGDYGEGLAVRILREALEHLQTGGRLVLYTGTPIVNGEDWFRLSATPLLDAAYCTYTYDEIDPDVFGEELDRPNYRNVDRLAVVALVVDIG